EGEAQRGSGFAVGLPKQLARCGVEGGDELSVAAVAVEHQRVADQGRRAAVAVDRVEGEVSVAPQDVAGEVETGGALVAEVDVKPPAADQRRRAGVAVLLVDGRG